MHKSASTGQFKSSTEAGKKTSSSKQSASQWEESEWSSYQSNSSYQSGAGAGSGVPIPEEITRAKDNFFSQRQAENASRPDHLPPSQGGRYTGFGNTAAGPPPRSQSEFDFGNAWSTFSSLASKATESAVKISNIAAQKATEIAGNVNEKVCAYLVIRFLSF
jgi:ADP-ribosylation factor GTPase-activating protein 1